MQAKDVVQRAYASLAAGNLLDLLGDLDDQVEWHEPLGFGAPLAGTHQGPTAVVRDVLGQLASRWPGYRLDPVDYFECGDRVVVLGDAVLIAVDGLPVVTAFAHVWRLREGRVVDVRVFADTALAMRNVAAADPAVTV